MHGTVRCMCVNYLVQVVVRFSLLQVEDSFLVNRESGQHLVKNVVVPLIFCLHTHTHTAININCTLMVILCLESLVCLKEIKVITVPHLKNNPGLLQ